jgi:dimeric dUTPase (all-alpha-NTP-PPase superfamily)
MLQQLKVMLDLQNNMNTKVHENWRDQEFQWYRAIWVECAELLDHYGWKWWKKQTPDLDQVILELIDIWHFGLSVLLQQHVDLNVIAQEVEDRFRNSLDTVEPVKALQAEDKSAEFRLNVESFALETLQSRSFSVEGFARLMGGVGLSFDRLYSQYVGKNVLNFFRQDHGYKDGTYKKQWGNKEDNEHLVELLQQLDTKSLHFKDELYDALSARYFSLLKNL